MGKLDIPKITWGAGNANTLYFGYCLDNWAAFSEDREGSEQYKSMAGVRDKWTTGTEYKLAGDVRRIPTNATASPSASGWDGPTGFRAFLEYARDLQPFMFYPDKNGVTAISSSLDEPMSGAPTLEPNGTRAIRIQISNTTTPYDGY